MDDSSANRELILNYLSGLSDATISLQERLVMWLFTINAGGIAGLLAYISTAQTSSLVFVGLWVFVFGLFAVFLSRVIMFYWLRRRLRSIYQRVSTMSAAEFVAHVRSQSTNNPAGECITWLSGIAALGGSVLAALGISL